MRVDEALLRAALAGPIPLPMLGTSIDVSRAKSAAVVVLLALDPDPSAILVLRAPHLHDHAGEVGFAGGKPDPADPSLEATALRELDEELGVRARDVTILGALTPVPVITGRYLIHPFVGVLASGAPSPVPSAEIARVLTLPISPLLEGRAPIHAVRGEWNDTIVFAPHFAVDGAVLYGASAYIFYELLLRLAAALGRALPEPVLTTELPWGDRYSRPEAR